MSAILTSIIKMFVAILPFVVICLSAKKVNLPKPDRSKQFIMPVVAIVYVIIAMILIRPLNTAVIALFGWLPKLLGGLSILGGLSSILSALLGGLNIKFWAFFISNIVIMSAYLSLKKICLVFIKKILKEDSSDLHQKVASNFYEFFPERNKWCLRDQYVQARSMFKTFFYGALILSTFLMFISRFLYLFGLMKSIFYPVFGILIVSEFYFYLDGLTKREYCNDILGEDENAYKIVNYSLLRKFLRSVFGDKLISENTSINANASYHLTTDDVINELEKSEDQKIQNFALFVDGLKKSGFAFDNNYLHSTVDMLNGKSVLFNNPFYNDLIPYAFYPMNRTLLSHQKVLVILGRHAIEYDVKDWIEKGIESVTNIPFMWNIGILDSESKDLDIGIVTRSDVLDIEMHNANSEFLEKVNYVVIIEPSKLISTAQIGLNLLAKKCRTEEDKNIVYCMCDKNCDGLVDAMSHTLMADITEVSATRKHQGTSSYMCWEADSDYLHHRLVPNISRYLGIGTELSFAALKNQVSKTTWYGGDAFPVVDMHWIDSQYYYDLTKYANLPSTQDSMNDFFHTSQNFWSAEVNRDSYITVEDEAFNMFEILRDFSTRTTEQGFINVISSDYLLKDYMADNASIFETDAKAIPYIVSDYTRSNRNTILRLLLMLSTAPVSSKVLEKELSLLGVSVFDLKKQLWFEIYNCYSDISSTSDISEDYKAAVNSVYSKSIELGGINWKPSVIKSEEKFNVKTGDFETLYFVADKRFSALCVADSRSASYVAEDEKGQRYYLGSELSGHIYQKYLPGQFFTFAGKYYEMQYLTADNQILVRRAADHITSRPAYRQIRDYTIHGVKPSLKIGDIKDVEGMKIRKMFADISVSTPGYYRMERYNDFSSAKKVTFEGDETSIPKRVYRNKEILCIELPEINGKLNDNIRYTITVLFNEIFKTIFAENQAYVCAVTDESFIGDDEKLISTYSVKGDGYELQNNVIYIIEDSQLDLGLTVAVERNLERILAIVNDYLDWHLDALEKSLNPPPEPRPHVVFTEEDNVEPPKEKGIKAIIAKIKGFFKKLIEKIKNFFKRKGKKPTDETPADETPADETPADEIPADEISADETPADEIPADEAPADETPADEIPAVETPADETPADEIPADEIPAVETPADEIPAVTPVVTEDISEGGNDLYGKISDNSVEMADESIVYETEDDCVAEKGFVIARKPYHERYYLLYGRENEVGQLDVTGTLAYLKELGLQRNALKQARDGKKIADYIEQTFKPGKADARYCDFCGAEIYGVEYETLADGRDRCINCGRTAIKTGEEFRKIFEDVKRNMESFYGIKINTGIKVEMVNAKKLHKRLKKAFIPTPNADGRVLGVAISDKNGYTLMIENGSPRMASMMTMVHELTHIWQYMNWDDKAIRQKYGNLRLEVYEGMAKWAEIQYAYLINEPAVAKREEIITSCRDDEYGRGFLRYLCNYPFSLGTVITKPTPFMNIETPLDSEYCGGIRVLTPEEIARETDDTTVPGDDFIPVSENIEGTIERDTEAVFRYAYNHLNDSEKKAYDVILDAIMNFADVISPFTVEITTDQISKIVEYIYADHPEIFWIRHGVTWSYSVDTGLVNKVEFTYCLTQQEAESRQKKIDMSIKSFLASITDSMSDFEVALRVYENIISLVDYDTIGLNKQKKDGKPAPEMPDDLRSIYGVFVNKKAVCAGYAKAAQYLYNLLGIECVYIVSDTHAWNLIKLEGDYYHLDVTWGDQSNTDSRKDGGNDVSYACFCITTKEVLNLKEHTPEDTLPLPECTATKCNYHVRLGLFFNEINSDRVRNIISKCVQTQKSSVSFKFSSADLLTEAKKQLVDGGKIGEFIRYANLTASQKFDVSYNYSISEEKCIMTICFNKI
ncbi:MAG: hypothetical protein J6D06_05010 [Clostridia bacterium]|nr:hypothetical protein [Clostridia bacterium]